MNRVGRGGVCYVNREGDWSGRKATNMQLSRVVLAVLICASMVPSVSAQEKQNNSSKSEAPVVASDSTTGGMPFFKIQMVLSEYDGTQKIATLPYVLHLTSGRDHGASLRLEEGVPYRSGDGVSGGRVATRIDCSALPTGNGQYELDIKVERDSMVPAKDSAPDQQLKPLPPISRSLTDSFILLMRDGQTMEAASTADPSTGHVMKIEVTFTVLK